MMKIFIVLVAVFIFTRCNDTSETLNLRKEDNGKQIKLSMNEEIVISLESNPTTGYNWTVANVDTNILEQTGKVEFEARSRKLGSPGKQIFRFRSTTAGKTALKLIYHRPWEKETAPLDTFLVEINVTE